MAKTYRINGYIVDPNGDDLNVMGKYDIFRLDVCARDVEVDVSETWEWDDECPENFMECTKEQFEERFKANESEKRLRYRHYWPCAIVAWGERKRPVLWATYEGCLTMEEAKRAIEAITKNVYAVYAAWVDDGNGHMDTFDCRVDAVGNIRKTDDRK